MKNTYDVIAIGGGLAGLTSAIHLSKKGLKVAVIEKDSYPKHKVCGEYISNEVVPYLKWLGVDFSELKPTQIHRVAVSNVSGKKVCGNLPLGGFGISRYTLDDYLMRLARSLGATIIQDKVTKVNYSNEAFSIVTAKEHELTAPVALGTFGKRERIEQQLRPAIFNRKSSWLAVKAHYTGDFPDDLVELHNFPGGYCGVSKVENNKLNICYLSSYDSFKKHGDIATFQEEVLYKNKQLKAILSNASMVFDQPITISQIDFKKKTIVQDHLLMMGDTAGLIYPLCGNGMAMAIQAAQLGSDIILMYFRGELNRIEMEKEYQKQWNKNFKKRILAGKLFSNLLRYQIPTELVRNLMTVFPSLLPLFIKQTHGKALEIHEH